MHGFSLTSAAPHFSHSYRSPALRGMFVSVCCLGGRGGVGDGHRSGSTSPQSQPSLSSRVCRSMAQGLTRWVGVAARRPT